MHESAENYLEVILILNGKIGQVCSIDMVNELGFPKLRVGGASWFNPKTQCRVYQIDTFF